MQDQIYDFFCIFFKNFFETFFIIALVMYMNKDLKFNMSRVIQITLVATSVLTMYDYYDKASKNVIRSSLLMSLGNQLY